MSTFTITKMFIDSLQCAYVILFEHYNSFQVTAIGILSIRQTFGSFIPRSFPLNNIDHVLIALYWDVHDLRNQGQILYRVSQDQPLLQEVGTNISQAFSTSFTPTRLFIATFDEVLRLSIPQLVRFLIAL